MEILGEIISLNEIRLLRQSVKDSRFEGQVASNDNYKEYEVKINGVAYRITTNGTVILEPNQALEYFCEIDPREYEK
jgi:hypothetical protein